MELLKYWPLIICLFLIGCTKKTDEVKETRLERKAANLQIYYFGADWCLPCKKMKKELWANPDVQKELLRYKRAAYFDIDKPENKDAVRGFKIKSVPTVVIVIEENGSLYTLDKKVGYSTRQFQDYLNLLRKYK